MVPPDKRDCMIPMKRAVLSAYCGFVLTGKRKRNETEVHADNNEERRDDIWQRKEIFMRSLA